MLLVAVFFSPKLTNLFFFHAMAFLQGPVPVLKCFFHQSQLRPALLAWTSREQESASPVRCRGPGAESLPRLM